MENLTGEEFTRLANNFYNQNKIVVDYGRIAIDSHLSNYVVAHKEEMKKKFKVALCCICLNPPYWEFIKPMIDSAKRFFLPGHNVDYLLWSDIKEATYGATVFETDPIEWPMPTLMRYSLFLGQEKKLKEYDYVFFCDADMLFVNVVGDEILGDGLTAVVHPGYFIRKELYPPYEPNERSAAYIKRPGRLIDDEGKPRFQPLYFAGGFQGGRMREWLNACKKMKKTIDKDFSMNYTSLWNDESHWNKYLFKHPPVVVLSPSYVYPDSLIKEYYEPIVWGCSFLPKIVTLTKKFTVSPDGGSAIQKIINK